MPLSRRPRPDSASLLWAALAAVGIGVAVWLFTFTPWYARLEGSTLDARFRLRPPIRQADGILTIDIDSAALEREKAWPWPRDRHTRLLTLAARLGVRAVGMDMFFAEPSPPSSVTRDDFFARGGQITASDFPDYDAEFVRAIFTAGTVYLAQTFTFHEGGSLAGSPQKLEQAENRLRTQVKRGAALQVDAAVAARFPAVAAPEAVPLARFADAAAGVGCVQVREDPDGVIRRYPVFSRYDLEVEAGQGRVPCVFPSLALLMACHALGVELDALVLDRDGAIILPLPDDGERTEIRIPVDEAGYMLINWAGGWEEGFPHVSYAAFDAIEERLVGLVRAKRRLADAGPDVWVGGPAAMIPVLAEVVPQHDLAALVQTLWPAHLYQEMLRETPDIEAEAALARIPGLPVDVPAVREQQFAVFRNVAAHAAALWGHARPAGVDDGLWRDALDIARVVQADGGVQPWDEPLFFQEPVRVGGRVVMAAGRSPLLRDAVCFYGLTATGTHDMRPTPISSAYPLVGVHANLYNGIVTGQLLHETPRRWRLPLYLVTGLIVALYAVQHGAARVAFSTFLLVALFLSVAMLLFVRYQWVVEISGPAIVIVGTAGAVFYQSYRREERQRAFIRGAFEQYMNPNIVERIADDPESLKLGGQELDATAFFSDVAGFTTISESLSSQELVALLNEYLTAMTEIVFRYDGLLDKYEGDAIIAIFGAPVQSSDHAVKACYASLDMQRKLVTMRQAWRTQGKPELTARIGLNSGLMTVGNMGSTMRFDYTMMGDTVNLASRLEGANKEYETTLMCSEFTIERCDGSVQARELDLLRVKGKNRPVRVYEVYAKSGEDLDPAFAKALEHYLRGVELYRDRQFAAAREQFETALQLRPDDGPSRTYLDRCQIYVEKPPPPEWDGVFTMTTK